jgi:DNA-binding response OmpR family regulator
LKGERFGEAQGETSGKPIYMGESDQMRVVVADDDKIIADTLAMILREHGFEAFAVYSGESTISTAIAVRPDLLISDLMMGELDAIDTVARVN